jgi:hypothetical protein
MKPAFSFSRQHALFIPVHIYSESIPAILFRQHALNQSQPSNPILILSPVPAYSAKKKRDAAASLPSPAAPRARYIILVAGRAPSRVNWGTNSKTHKCILDIAWQRRKGKGGQLGSYTQNSHVTDIGHLYS